MLPERVDERIGIEAVKRDGDRTRSEGPDQAQFLVGFESPAWFGETDLNADLDLFSYMLNFTWYPGAKGWFLRAGFGGGSAEVSTTINGTRLSVEDSGGSFGFGAGHEWRLTQKFALGAAVDFNTIDLDYGKFDFANFTAQLNWYF